MDLEKPLLRVVASRIDYLQKSGGGSAKPPLVDVTNELINGLLVQLDQVAARLPLASREGSRPAAMVVRLREGAWAKSNRPNELFSRAEIPVAAVEGVGELILPVTAQKLDTLKGLLNRPLGKKAKFHISTIEEFAAWAPEDVLSFFGASGVRGGISRAISQGQRFRVELFPWAEAQASQLVLSEDAPVIESGSARFGYISAQSADDVLALAREPEVRRIVVEPKYAVPTELGVQAYIPLGGTSPVSLDSPSEELPVVGVLDTGISSPALDPFVVAREVYELPPEADYLHGTFVGGLAAASRLLNGGDGRFPAERARLLDAVVLPSSPIPEGDLLVRLQDAVARHPEVKVWNCSFASSAPNHPLAFGPFAAELDRISDQAGVLFVVAAGNYSPRVLPIRQWPAGGAHYPEDGLASPGESVRALTVGALALTNCAVPADCPAPYSRRGPGPAFFVKPDVVHYGGGLDLEGEIMGGVRSLIPGDSYVESVGTSFSTPIVSCIAANAWKYLESSGSSANPTLVKALVVHSAALSSPPRSAPETYYFGHGVPTSAAEALFCDESVFTTLHEVELQQGVDWQKLDFPIPGCLRTPAGAVRAEFVITLCYASPCDISFGDEYIQHDVEVSFGTYDPDPERPGHRKHIGKVPLDRPVGLNTREKQLLEDGLKYSTTKVYRARFPRGCSGEQWRLKLSLTRRLELGENVTQPAYVLVSIRGLEPGLPVYVDGLRAIPNSWQVSQLVRANAVVSRVRR